MTYGLNIKNKREKKIVEDAMNIQRKLDIEEFETIINYSKYRLKGKRFLVCDEKDLKKQLQKLKEKK